MRHNGAASLNQIPGKGSLDEDEQERPVVHHSVVFIRSDFFSGNKT
jgi:hypothetical protein